MTTIDFFASEVHYLDHVAPVWHALPQAAQGEFVVPDRLLARALARGIRASSTTGGHSPFGLVGSYRDLLLLQRRTAGLVFMEHGHGQSYKGYYRDDHIARHPAYAGGADRDRVSLFLCPNEHSSDRNREAYPDAVVANVGSPWLDTILEHAKHPPQREKGDERPPTIAVAFHSNIEVCPETMSAWPHWEPWLLDMLLDSRDANGRAWRVIGHGHPRALYPQLAHWYERTGEIVVVPEFEQVVHEADVLVCDNSTVMYAWAALDRPVVALNAPWWHRDINHGLRFWDAVPGPQVDDPVDLPDAMTRADDRKARARAVQAAFGTVDGKAAHRAAAAILDLVG